MPTTYLPEFTPVLEDFIRFIYKTDSDLPIDHTNWTTCSVGDYVINTPNPNREGLTEMDYDQAKFLGMQGDAKWGGFSRFFAASALGIELMEALNRRGRDIFPTYGHLKYFISELEDKYNK